MADDGSVLICGTGSIPLPKEGEMDLDRCPRCRSEMLLGYGLMGGGLGAYNTCVECDWIVKVPDGDDDA